MEPIHHELNKSSRISENIYLSGIYPLNNNSKTIQNLGIKFILSCVDRKYIGDIHDMTLINNKDVMIIYLPYDDVVTQNLWQLNNGKNFNSLYGRS